MVNSSNLQWTPQDVKKSLADYEIVELLKKQDPVASGLLEAIGKISAIASNPTIDRNSNVFKELRALQDKLIEVETEYGLMFAYKKTIANKEDKTMTDNQNKRLEAFNNVKDHILREEVEQREIIKACIADIEALVNDNRDTLPANVGANLLDHIELLEQARGKITEASQEAIKKLTALADTF